MEVVSGRVVPIRVDDTFENVEKLLLQLNGVLFPGGPGAAEQGTILWNQVNDVQQEDVLEDIDVDERYCLAAAVAQDGDWMKILI